MRGHSVRDPVLVIQTRESLRQVKTCLSTTREKATSTSLSKQLMKSLHNNYRQADTTYKSTFERLTTFASLSILN